MVTVTENIGAGSWQLTGSSLPPGTETIHRGHAHFASRARRRPADQSGQTSASRFGNAAGEKVTSRAACHARAD